MGFVDVCALPGFRAPPKKGPRGVYASLQFPCNPRMEVSALLLRLARTGGNHATTVLALHCQLDSAWHCPRSCTRPDCWQCNPATLFLPQCDYYAIIHMLTMTSLYYDSDILYSRLAFLSVQLHIRCHHVIMTTSSHHDDIVS
jgi:hypothetical protein